MPTFNADDHRFMAEALKLAQQGLYSATPNPRVGCVLVQAGQIVGRGWHRTAGEAHAEVVALKDAGGQAAGASVYVSLEPCNHHGHTPPCTEALLVAGVKKVVAAIRDPNPQSNSGLVRLQAAGVETAFGLLEEEARELNMGFISRVTRARPWVRLKCAASLDGKTALSSGESQWITNAEARHDNQHWRARSCAILTGIGTQRQDDPRLNVREIEIPRQPLRVVVDTHLRMDPASRLLQNASSAQVLIVCAKADKHKSSRLRESGAEVISLPGGTEQPQVDLEALLSEMARRGINEVQVEAGARLNGALLSAGLVDELLLYLAPCLLGDQARGLAILPGLEQLVERPVFKLRDVCQFGDHLRLQLRPE